MCFCLRCRSEVIVCLSVFQGVSLCLPVFSSDARLACPHLSAIFLSASLSLLRLLFYCYLIVYIIILIGRPSRLGRTTTDLNRRAMDLKYIINKIPRFGISQPDEIEEIVDILPLSKTSQTVITADNGTLRCQVIFKIVV